MTAPPIYDMMDISKTGGLFMPTKEEYYWYKERHICTDCQKQPAFSNYTLCADCLYKRQVRSQNYTRSKESKERNKQIKKELIKSRKGQGLCPRCGKKALPGKVLCLECNMKNNHRVQEYRDRHKVYIENKCRYCNNQCVEGKKVCAECLEKLQKQAEYARTFVNTKDHVWQKENKQIFGKANKI